MSFQPVIPSNSYGQNLGQMNNMIRQLNKEQIVKAFKQPGGNAIVDGRYAEGRYGNIYSDPDNVRSILIGQHPVDGHMIIALTKDGFDVIDELS